jgi:hypothetical protein
MLLARKPLGESGSSLRESGDLFPCRLRFGTRLLERGQ